MEYVYAALLLHSAGKEINEANLTKILKAPGIKVDKVRVKALAATLEDVDIDDAIQQVAVAAVAAPAAAPAAPTAEGAEAGKAGEKEKEEEKEETEEEALAGLGALFG
ncbi:MAG: 50S ribosomal protein P1 [Candidatus Hydrothermarchaeaceae archaeon]